MNQNLVVTIGYLVVVFGAMYFLLIAPQNRQRKAQAATVAALRPGDEVLTTGGMYGTVRGVDDDTVRLEIASGVVIKVAKGAIAVRVDESAITPSGS
jgi:preprotein translocase subunit YajC